MKKTVFHAIVATAALCCSVALADWNVGGEHIMHFPQLPNGEEDILVELSDKPDFRLADDWLYTGGAVGDAHIWTSWFADTYVPTYQVKLWILEDDAGQPGTTVWSGTFYGDNSLGKDETLTERLWSSGDNTSDWVNPFTSDPASDVDNHGDIYQINIPDLTLGVDQSGSLDGLSADNTYWLAAVINDADPSHDTLGWHTSTDAWGSSAMWYDTSTGWNAFADPSYDLAFVMTPEPSGLALLMLAGVSLATRRRRQE